MGSYIVLADSYIALTGSDIVLAGSYIALRQYLPKGSHIPKSKTSARPKEHTEVIFTTSNAKHSDITADQDMS